MIKVAITQRHRWYKEYFYCSFLPLGPYPEWCILSSIQTPLRVLFWILNSLVKNSHCKSIVSPTLQPPHYLYTATLFWPEQKLGQSFSSSFTVHPAETFLTLNFPLFPFAKVKSNLLALEWFFCILRVRVRASLWASSPWNNSREAEEQRVYAARACGIITRASNLVPSAVQVWKLHVVV